MSVKELVLGDLKVNHNYKPMSDDEMYWFRLGECCLYLDRNQAHLLYLYLQEHLGYNKHPTISKEMWLCGCGKYHMKDFVCERLNETQAPSS